MEVPIKRDKEVLSWPLPGIGWHKPLHRRNVPSPFGFGGLEPVTVIWKTDTQLLARARGNPAQKHPRGGAPGALQPTLLSKGSPLCLPALSIPPLSHFCATAHVALQRTYQGTKPKTG